jgi:small-conductance mechanosensitive channel
LTLPRATAYLWPPMPALFQSSTLDAVAEFFRLPPGELPRTLIRVAVIWLLAWFAIRVIHLIARRIIAAVDDGDDSTLTAAEKRGQTIAQLLRSVGRVAVLGLTVLLTLDVFFDIGPLLAGAGILGLAVSFGAQSLVKDVISGFFILVENQFVVGDVVEAAGKSGTVERMTLRVVMLRDLRGVLHIVPNGQIAAVSNFTRSWSRAVVEVNVAYSTDVDHAAAVRGRRHVAGPARGRAGRAGSRAVRRERGHHPGAAPDHAGGAVGSGAGVPPADQEPAGPGGDRDALSATGGAGAPGARAERLRPG